MEGLELLAAIGFNETSLELIRRVINPDPSDPYAPSRVIERDGRLLLAGPLSAGIPIWTVYAIRAIADVQNRLEIEQKIVIPPGAKSPISLYVRAPPGNPLRQQQLERFRQSMPGFERTYQTLVRHRMEQQMAQMASQLAEFEKRLAKFEEEVEVVEV